VIRGHLFLLARLIELLTVNHANLIGAVGCWTAMMPSSNAFDLKMATPAAQRGGT